MPGNIFSRMRETNTMDLLTIIGNSPRYWTAGDRVSVLKEAYDQDQTKTQTLIANLNHEGAPGIIASITLGHLDKFDFDISCFLGVIYRSFSDPKDAALKDRLKEIADKCDYTF
jgi:hypothetical protein